MAGAGHQKSHPNFKMYITEKDALDLLFKWRDEQRIVSCFFLISLQQQAKIIGRIDEIDNNNISISASSFSILFAEQFQMLFPLHNATYEYLESRDIPEDADRTKAAEETIESMLNITLPNATIIQLCVIYPIPELNERIGV